MYRRNKTATGACEEIRGQRMFRIYAGLRNCFGYMEGVEGLGRSYQNRSFFDHRPADVAPVHRADLKKRKNAPPETPPQLLVPRALARLRVPEFAILPNELGHVDGTDHQNETGEKRVVKDGGSDELEAAQQASEPLAVQHLGVDRVENIKLVDQGDAAGQGENVSELELPQLVARTREPARKHAPSSRSPVS